MTTVIHRNALGLAALWLLASGGGVLAEEVAVVQATPVATALAPTAPQAPRSPLGTPVDAHRLAAGRGASAVLNDMKLRGVVADTQASHLTTGTNTISDGSFGSAVGLPVVIQNSGNNVLIQNATIVNVQVK